MIAILLMAIGAIMALIGFLGLSALMIEPLYTMYMVIFKRKDDYVYYETKPGKALLQKEKKSLRGSCLFLLFVGILCFGLGWFLKFGPRGTDSLFSKQVESGTAVGDEEHDHLAKQVINAAGNYVDAQGEEHYYYIIVKGDRISYRREFEGDLEAFGAFVEKMDSKNAVYLVDDFAVSSTFYAVRDLLVRYGIGLEEEGQE